FDEGQMKVGRRLAVKLLNASKFALGFPEAEPGPVTEPVDQALLARLAAVVDEATAAFEAYDYTRALERTESFFWSFCDDYIELVKGRAYGEDAVAAASANRALRIALDALLRLFAPVLPFVTEEVWSWWQEGSVHVQAWPTSAPLREASGREAYDRGSQPLDALDIAAAVLERVRGEKSRAKTSMKTPVLALHAVGTAQELALLSQVEADLRNACLIRSLTTEESGDAFDVPRIELGDPPPKVARS
ncbi:MAG: valine--tRNA ligase, partial [Frankiaceae bacterium]|nr:valine--tRNA ligase [Frankiaceae bacterium]